MHPTQNLKPNIILDFIFAYGCTNPEVIFIHYRFRNLEDYFRILFKFLDDHIQK